MNPGQSDSRDPKTIWDLKRTPWSDDPRYYPPGSHPATYRYRAILKKIEELGHDDSEAASWYRDEIAKFEQAESEAKARDDAMLRRRGERDA